MSATLCIMILLLLCLQATSTTSPVTTTTLSIPTSPPPLTTMSIPMTSPTQVNDVGLIPVNLGTAAKYTILAKLGVSTVPQSRILGDIGLSRAAATFLTGFSLTKSLTGQSAVSVQVTGSLFASDFVTPTPQNLVTAIGDMITAYNDAVGRVPTSTNLNVGAGGLGGLTLTAGTYKFTSAVNIATDLTLVGTPLDTWIFQIAGGLTTSSVVKIILVGGALPKNTMWAVAGAVSIGTTRVRISRRYFTSRRDLSDTSNSGEFKWTDPCSDDCCTAASGHRDESSLNSSQLAKLSLFISGCFWDMGLET